MAAPNRTEKDRPPGTAKPHRDLYEVVTQDRDGGPVRVIDRAIEAYRLGLGDVDVAARCGVHKETIRTWMKDGTNLATDLHAGRREWGSLSKQERKVVDFVQQATLAEAEGKLFYLGLAERVASGGARVRTVTEKVGVDEKGAERLIERTVREEQALPDPGMIKWVLSHRWREEFGDRISAEISGPGGGPLSVDVGALVAGMRAEVDRLADARSETDELLREALSTPGTN